MDSDRIFCNFLHLNIYFNRVLQESLNALKTILKEIDYQAFDKALQNKDSSKYLAELIKE